MSEPITKVIFRIDKRDREVFAMFPEDPGADEYHFTVYVHNGQHGSGTRDGCVNPTTRPAKPSEYADLKAELERIGYRLRVIQRIPSDAIDTRRRQIRRAV